MFNAEQNDLIHEIVGFGVPLESKEINGMPGYILKGFGNQIVTLLPLIDTSDGLFEASNITSEPVEHRFVKGTKTTHINTKIKNIDQLAYYYYHFYKITKQSNPSFKMNPFWEKFLVKYNYQEKFAGNALKEHIINYFLNTTVINETTYSIK